MAGSAREVVLAQAQGFMRWLHGRSCPESGLSLGSGLHELVAWQIGPEMGSPRHPSRLECALQLLGVGSSLNMLL